MTDRIAVPSDDRTLQVRYWPTQQRPRAIVQLAHGMGEHIDRYQRLACALAEAQYAVYGYNHRGHGDAIVNDLPGAMGPDGWNATLGDMHRLNQFVQQEHPDIPHVLLGHSMGAMLAQQYLCRWPGSLDALILSGSPGFTAKSLLFVGTLIARFEAWRLGANQCSPLLQKLLFGDANKPFNDTSPEPTGYEWLSRDSGAVAAYVNDPHCGFVLSADSVANMLQGNREAQTRSNFPGSKLAPPIFLLSGAADPIHNDLKQLHAMVQRYKAAGLSVRCKYYEGGRHEMFNETNQQEVFADLIAWLGNQTAVAQ